MEEIKIEYEVEKSTDAEGGVYFSTLEEAIKYYAKEIDFCVRQKKERTCDDDFEIFESIQVNKHTEYVDENEYEVEILLSQRIN